MGVELQESLLIRILDFCWTSVMAAAVLASSVVAFGHGENHPFVVEVLLHVSVRLWSAFLKHVLVW